MQHRLYPLLPSSSRGSGPALGRRGGAARLRRRGRQLAGLRPGHRWRRSRPPSAGATTWPGVGRPPRSGSRYDWQPLSGGVEIRFSKRDWQPGEVVHFHARDQLVTTIEKVEGKTLTLRDGANRTVADAVVRHCDSAALQAAIGRAVKEKRNLRVPAGYYRLARGLTIDDASGIAIEGASGEQTVLDITEREGACMRLRGRRRGRHPQLPHDRPHGDGRSGVLFPTDQQYVRLLGHFPESLQRHHDRRRRTRAGRKTSTPAGCPPSVFTLKVRAAPEPPSRGPTPSRSPTCAARRPTGTSTVIDATTFQSSRSRLPMEWEYSHRYRGWSLAWISGAKPNARCVIDSFDPRTMRFKLRQPHPIKVGDRFEVFPPSANWNIHGNTITGCLIPVVLDAYGSPTSIFRDNVVTRGDATDVTQAIDVRGQFHVVGNQVFGFDKKLGA